MIKIKDYVRVGSLEEAYELNQKRSACILGGMLWTKMGQRQVQTAIDLSGLGLDQIEESEEEFSFGCMVTLRQLEEHEGLNAYTDGAARESVRSIVGVQFRNLATVGGSIFGRFGFSDVLTLFLALDTEVELVHAGRMPLAEFACSKRDRDVLVRLIVKKHEGVTVYQSHRNSRTDFPVLSCSVLAARANGCKVDTLEGLQEEAEEFGSFIAGQGAEQCGFCNPGMIMNAIALFRENPDPSEEEIKEYLAGNLCRCSGYEGQLRGILNFLAWKKQQGGAS